MGPRPSWPAASDLARGVCPANPQHPPRSPTVFDQPKRRTRPGRDPLSLALSSDPVSPTELKNHCTLTARHARPARPPILGLPPLAQGGPPRGISTPGPRCHRGGLHSTSTQRARRDSCLSIPSSLHAAIRPLRAAASPTRFSINKAHNPPPRGAMLNQLSEDPDLCFVFSYWRGTRP